MDCTTHTPPSSILVNSDHHKSDQRSNFSCESVTFSDHKVDNKSDGRSDCKSVSVSFQDDDSTKALAGSICYRYVLTGMLNLLSVCCLCQNVK